MTFQPIAIQYSKGLSCDAILLQFAIVAKHKFPNCDCRTKMNYHLIVWLDQIRGISRWNPSISIHLSGIFRLSGAQGEKNNKTFSKEYSRNSITIKQHFKSNGNHPISSCIQQVVGVLVGCHIELLGPGAGCLQLRAWWVRIRERAAKGWGRHERMERSKCYCL